jgi:hypothetical protein
LPPSQPDTSSSAIATSDSHIGVFDDAPASLACQRIQALTANSATTTRLTDMWMDRRAARAGG